MERLTSSPDQPQGAQAELSVAGSLFQNTKKSGAMIRSTLPHCQYGTVNKIPLKYQHVGCSKHGQAIGLHI